MKPYEAFITVGAAAVVAGALTRTGTPIEAVGFFGGIVAVVIGVGLYLWHRYMRKP